MRDLEQFVGGICIFCNEQGTDIHYTSSQYSHTECRCPESAEYYRLEREYSRILFKLSTCARARKTLLEIQSEEALIDVEIHELEEKKLDLDSYEKRECLKVLEGSNGKDVMS